MPAVDIVTHLRDFCGSSLVAMTSGSEGCALATKSQASQTIGIHILRFSSISGYSSAGYASGQSG